MLNNPGVLKWWKLPALVVNPEAFLFVCLESSHRTNWGAWAGCTWLEPCSVTGALRNPHQGESWHEFEGRLYKCMRSLVYFFNWSEQIIIIFFLICLESKKSPLKHNEIFSLPVSSSASSWHFALPCRKKPPQDYVPCCREHFHFQKQSIQDTGILFCKLVELFGYVFSNMPEVQRFCK